jgi:hypothetical protein
VAPDFRGLYFRERLPDAGVQRGLQPFIDSRKRVGVLFGRAADFSVRCDEAPSALIARETAPGRTDGVTDSERGALSRAWSHPQ